MSFKIEHFLNAKLNTIFSQCDNTVLSLELQTIKVRDGDLLRSIKLLRANPSHPPAPQTT